MSCECGGCPPPVVRVDCEGLCKDGLSAYELWAYNQAADADTSRKAFFDSMKGTQVASISIVMEDVTNG